MEDPRPDSLETVAARVVAWHNRHPLARRITAEQVQSVGFVGLPYLPPPESAGAPHAAKPAAGEGEAPAGGSLRERALARAKQSAGDAPPDLAKAARARRRLKAAFTEDFIAPLSPQRVARWAGRHGVALDPVPRGAPLRQVEPDAAFASQGRQLQTLYVLTAAVESRGKRVRMLLSPSTDSAVLGGRLWSPPRLAGGAAGAVGGLAALGLALALWWQTPATPGPAVTARAGTVAHETGGHIQTLPNTVNLPSIKPGPMRAAALADAGLADPAAGPASGTAASRGAPPVGMEPTLGRISLPALGLPRGDEAWVAARERRLAQQLPPNPASAPTATAPPHAAAAPASPASAGTTPASALTAATAPASAPHLAPGSSKPQAAAASQAAAAPPAPPPAFALSSRRLRTRAESEQTMAAVKSLLAGAGHDGVQVEVVPAGDDFRVVGWPFGQRVQAEKARTLLASRGIRLEVVAF